MKTTKKNDPVSETAEFEYEFENATPENDTSDSETSETNTSESKTPETPETSSDDSETTEDEEREKREALDGENNSPDISYAIKEMNKMFMLNMSYAHHYFVDEGGFYEESDEIKRYANRGTGYKNMDKVQDFCPGLYVIGAVSSLGKTTFVHQMADQLAASGRNVMYFSLEQSHFELYSKSLARRFALEKTAEEKNLRPTSYELRRGDYENYRMEMRHVVNGYANDVRNRLCIIDGMFEITVEQIVKTVSYFAERAASPVIFIDYLQIIAPTPGKNGHIPDTRTTIDHAIHALKVLQQKYNLTIVVVSSINRANYLLPISFESFKESGGIEFTADVVWGMQLSLIGTDAYKNSAKTVTEQRNQVQKAKEQNPRYIDLIYLKNRFGSVRGSQPLHFTYYPASDLFVPCEKLTEAQILSGITDKGDKAPAPKPKPKYDDRPQEIKDADELEKLLFADIPGEVKGENILDDIQPIFDYLERERAKEKEEDEDD